jgi:hypothetical protein
MGHKWRLWAVFLAASPALWSAPMCTSTTLNNYVSLGLGGCQIGSAIFSNFSYTYTVGLLGPPNPPDTSDPVVTASDVTVDVAGSLFAPDLIFQASMPGFPWQASNGFQTQIDLVYTVTVPALTPLEDSSAGISGTVQNNGGFPSNITSTFSYSSTFGALTPSVFPSNCGPAATTCTSAVSGEIGLSNLLQVTVSDLITLDSGGTANSSSNVPTLSQFEQSFGEVPEPSSLLTMTFGLALWGWLALRARRTAQSRQGN